jgi:hypothetical protein
MLSIGQIMTENPDSLKTRLEVWKNIAEICAILIAGLWAVYVFIQKEVPLLESRAIIDSALSLTQYSSSACKATMTVHFENTGTSPIEITRVSIKQWNFQLDDSGYFDLEAKTSGTPIEMTYSFDDSNKNENIFRPFIQKYTSGEKYFNSFVWIIPPQQGTQILFLVQLFTDDKTQPPWQTYAWSPIECNE